jgi:predicted phosphoribosyltransferase
VARALDFPLEIVLTKKIGHPMNKEYAIGAASLTDHFVIPHEKVSDEYIRQELLRIRTRLKEMFGKFMGNRMPASLEGKTVIVVDDGIATGNTLLATVQLLRKSKPRKIVIGVPVAPKEAVDKISQVVDELVTVITPKTFFGVGAFYKDFKQLSDEDALRCLEKMKDLRKTG